MTKILTIDGPSGVGKGTISEYLSDKLIFVVPLVVPTFKIIVNCRYEKQGH